ncbi:hypothetical protein KFL_000340030 [Klebsormidium nitens]|uniref:Uncharacterized protein n=1 Tax=Klebsormidium nitens TaxID=105231 RepID=A0A1Y1HQY9_KLENI|nr:hypothetical protein KFL_000340030 [Klebsormidium nitens]|eukprot:GAQ79599.1 hypothetical protein KFL_000340030 [Klebsormidium nitens]
MEGRRSLRIALLCIASLCMQFSMATTTKLYTDTERVHLFETAEEFNTAVVESDDRVWLVNFFADDCDNCILLATQVPKIAEKLDGFVEVGAVNCTQVPIVCGATGIKFLPSLKVFDWEVKENPYTGVPYKEPPKEVLKDGEVDPAALVKQVKGFVPDAFVRQVASGSAEAEQLFQETGIPKVLFLSTKDKPSALLKALSLRYRERLEFLFGSSTDEELLQKLPAGSEGQDSLFVIKPGGETLLHDGPLKKDALTEFLSAHAIERPPKAPRAAPASEDDIAIDETPSRTGHLTALNASGFEQEVFKVEAAWVVAFFREPCEEQYEQWGEASLPLSGQVRLGTFNLSAHPEGEKFWADAASGAHLTAKDCLRVLSYPFGEDKEEGTAELYEGPLEGKALYKFGLDSVPDFVTPLESNEALDVFLSREQWKPKMLLFTAKKETPDMWRALAARFRNAIGFALVHEDDSELLERLRITKVPKVLTIFAQPSEESGELGLSIQPFPRALKHSNLAMWCHQISATLEATRRKGGAGALSVRQLTSDEDFQQQCVDKGICIVGLLDGSQGDPSGQVDTLKQVAQLNPLGPVSYAWVDVTSAPGFAYQLGLSRSDAPTVVLLNAKKMRYARLEGAFNVRTLTAFADGVVSGKIGVSKLDALPTFAAAPPEDEDVSVEEVEEEFNLEEIMKEEVDAGDAKSRQEKLAELEKQLKDEAAALLLEKEKAAKTGTTGPSKKKKKKKKAASKGQNRAEL